VRLLALAAVSVALALAAPGAAAPAATIDVSGSTTALPLVADLAFFYRQEVRRPPRFRIVGGNTEAGITDVSRGVVDVAMVSRPRLPSDPRRLVFAPFAASAICLVTHRSNPVPGFDWAQLQGLVSGSLTRWEQIAGAGRSGPIVHAAFAPATAALIVFLATFVDEDTPIGYEPRSFSTAAQMRAFVRATPAAWGYVDLAFTDGLHVVPYEGVPCTRATVADSSYPGRRELSLVTKGAPSRPVARFLRWMRTSRTARRVIASRYVRVR
jgi:ABC-type phosphate transport system substrate-binding protein